MISSKRLSRLETTQEEIRRQLDTIVTALIVSEPRTAVAAEAFDGLRRTIAFAAQERRRLLIQLVAFADAIERGATLDTLRELCQQWCAEAGVARYDDPQTQPDWFTVVEGDGPRVEVVEPAWIDAEHKVLLRPGTARRRPAPDAAASKPGPEPAGPPEPGPEQEPAPPEAAEPETEREPVGAPADAPEEAP